jgi:lysyl-tRNA synthetase class 2
MQPLARVSDKDANIVEQFQCLVNGREICKAYSELVDPLLQQANFDKQAENGDEEATAGDEAFVEAMEYGMPPQSGFGMGLERILAILTEQDNLRDVVMFPLMKPRTDNKEE